MRSNRYIVRGKSRGRPAWHEVLLSSGDEEYTAQYKAQVATGRVDVADWGYILASGLGEDPPQSIKDKIKTWTRVSSY